jgi:hypothetical protein
METITSPALKTDIKDKSSTFVILLHAYVINHIKMNNELEKKDKG